MSRQAERPMLGAVEGGGTKFVCAVGYGPHEQEMVAQARIATTSPEATIREVGDFFAGQHSHGSLAGLGIACFGPLELNPGAPGYGRMLSTPKPGWSGAPIVAPLASRLGVPVALDTDVNGAAMGEWRWGAAQGCDPALYLTVGTGIGGGALVNGRPVRGLMHPEMGHIPMPRLRWPDGRQDDFVGSCPFHRDCLEGMIAGPAIRARMGVPAEQVPSDHPLWTLVADYLATALATFVLMLSPERLVIGGGLTQQPGILDRVRQRLPELLNGYVPRPQITEGIEHYLVAPHFGQEAGLAGAFALAERASGAAPAG